MGLAVSSAVALQEAAGLDVVTDGEWWRKSYIGVIAELAHGFELGTLPGRPAVDRSWSTASPRSSPASSPARSRSSRASPASRSRRRCPSPALLGERLWDPEKSAKAYPKREDFVARLRADPARGVAAAGPRGRRRSCRSTTRTCACSSIRTCGRKYDDPDRAAAFAVDMTNQVVDGVRRREAGRPPVPPGRARARGEARFQGGYGPILPHLNRLKVHHLTMEFTAPEAGDMAVFRDLREDFEIGLGCVGTRAGRGRHGGRDRRAGGDGPEAPGRRSGSRSTPTAASPRARPPW